MYNLYVARYLHACACRLVITLNTISIEFPKSFLIGDETIIGDALGATKVTVM